MVVLSGTVFLVIDFDVVVPVLVVVAFDVLVVSAVVAVVVIVVSDDVTALEAFSAAVVVWLTAEVTAVGSSFTVFSVAPQAVSMADNMMISIAFFIDISSFQQHHTIYTSPMSSLFGKLLPFGLFTQRVFLHVYQSRLSE